MARLTIAQAADTLGVAQSTIRKRLRSGDLEGQKVKGAGGFKWEVFVADDLTVNSVNMAPFTNDPGKGDTNDGNHANDAQDGDDDNGGNGGNHGPLVHQMQARIDSLETQLTTRAGEIDQLHRLLAQTALNAASGRPWWAFWR